jgi:hypothetical protein
MNRIECTCEPAVVEAVVSGQWPHRADDALVTHALECEVCREVASIATLMHDDYDRSRYEAQVPAAGQVWWRAAIRARLESTQTATKPMTWLHGMTAAAAVGVLLAVFTLAWPLLPPMLESGWTLVAGYFPNPEVASAMANGLRVSAFVGLAAAAILVLAPLALYFALSDDK